MEPWHLPNMLNEKTAVLNAIEEATEDPLFCIRSKNNSLEDVKNSYHLATYPSSNKHFSF